MAYRFRVNELTCINCGICMDLCVVRCLDMTRPSGEGTIASGVASVEYASRGPVTHVPKEGGWLPLASYSLATHEEPCVAPWRAA